MSHPEVYRIRITVSTREVEAILNNSEMSRDFVSLLPLNLAMKDLFSREKYGGLSRPLSGKGSQIHSYEVGDIAYWRPGQDLTIFYRQDGQGMEKGLYKLGRIKSSIQTFNTPGSIPAKIELVPQEQTIEDNRTGW